MQLTQQLAYNIVSYLISIFVPCIPDWEFLVSQGNLINFYISWHSKMFNEKMNL